jgi:hypothetical protein
MKGVETELQQVAQEIVVKVTCQRCHKVLEPVGETGEGYPFFDFHPIKICGGYYSFDAEGNSFDLTSWNFVICSPCVKPFLSGGGINLEGVQVA